ncbi:YdbC family protein [Kroppenstedtia sanguinis]|uniref:YdbC family protein n=1 Tax=Kroppenstedtia sanguinis TaxID=1380684 RepID=A0ABW4CA28_9BACL
MSSASYEIRQTVGTLSENTKGWKKELNWISWNGREPKYDLRSWSSDHERMGKGVTLTTEELRQLRDLLNGMEL